MRNTGGGLLRAGFSVKPLHRCWTTLPCVGNVACGVRSFTTPLTADPAITDKPTTYSTTLIPNAFNDGSLLFLHKLEPMSAPRYPTPYTQLTEAQKEEIRSLRNSDPDKWTRNVLAKKFNVPIWYVSRLAPCPPERISRLQQAKEEALGLKRVGLEPPSTRRRGARGEPTVRREQQNREKLRRIVAEAGGLERYTKDHSVPKPDKLVREAKAHSRLREINAMHKGMGKTKKFRDFTDEDMKELEGMDPKVQAQLKELIKKAKEKEPEDWSKDTFYLDAEMPGWEVVPGKKGK
ncbi:Mitochondrial ribosomal protein subunit L20-domain-containing protein [Balamuthia mandrillaris]